MGFTPGLQDENVPEVVVPVAAPAEMLLPLLAHRRGVDQPLAPEPLLRDQLLGPLAQRPAEPLVDRQAEPQLRAVDERAGEVAVENLAQGPLRAAIPHLQRQRKR